MQPSTKSKGGRPPTGSPKWNAKLKRWEARVTLPGTDLRRVVPMLKVSEGDRATAKVLARRIALLVQRSGMVPEESEETVNEWSERWIASRRDRGLATVAHDNGRLKHHVLPTIGTLPMSHVTRDDIERVVVDLDRKIDLSPTHEDHLSWKTASNVYTLVTSMFRDAVSSKRRDLRCRADNPTTDVRGPERGDDRAKTYLYPSEFLSLVECAAVDLSFRVLYAVAAYTYARAGEIEALTWGDVDLTHGVIHINKAIDRKTHKVKSTKSGDTRRIPIESALRPLLESLYATALSEAVDDTKGDTRAQLVKRVSCTPCFWMPDAEDRAVLLRQHLTTALVTRTDLFTDDAHRKHITFHDLRSTGITWMAVRGDDPLRIKQRAGHKSFSTTEGYIREAENLVNGFGDPFPPLPFLLPGGSGFGSGVVASEILENTEKNDFFSGAKGDRTPDLCIANAALSQLSYCPKKRGAESHAPPV